MPPRLTPKKWTTQLLERCKAANIACTKVDEDEDEDGDESYRVQMPNGRTTRPVTLYDVKMVRALLAVTFEKYVFLNGYNAIASFQDKTIESLITTIGRGLLYPTMRALFRENTYEQLRSGEYDPLVVSDPGFAPGVSIRIGPASDPLKRLTSAQEHKRMSITITGCTISRHNDAVDLLERVANSLFLQIDLARGIPIGLMRAPRRLATTKRVRQDPTELTFPRTEYDAAPMALYWYGRSAVSMPLLQFLAFYQCVEFYFPTCHAAEAKRRIQGILKDPTFRPDRDTDIGRIIAALTSGQRSGTADELTMLKATLRECIDSETLRSFVEEDEGRKTALSKKIAGLTDQGIPVANSKADLREDVAKRIYDIRCRIVHTKVDGGSPGREVLLPFSKEEQQITHDVDLMQFVAQKALITGSSKLEMPGA